MTEKPRCLLIWPPITTYGSDSPADPSLPLGLAYIAAYLEKHGYQPKILDALALGGKQQGEGFVRTGMSRANIEAYIRDFKPDIVGISTMFSAYAQDAHEVAKIVKEINSSIPVVFGGAHTSINPEMVLRDENVDVVVKGEGEETFLEIVRALEVGDRPKDIAGTIVKANGELKINPERPFIADLDSIPLPARHLLPMDTYVSGSSPYWMRKPLLPMITSRGCPRNCIFCSIHSVWGHSWRARNAKSVVDEIEHLVNEYGVREIHFLDDNISINKKRMNEICDEIIGRKLDIKWAPPNGIAIWTLDEPLIKKMKRSGCYRLTFGIETGNPEMQKFVRKNLDLERARRLIAYANKIGLWTISTNIIGFPYETREQIEDTINYAISSGVDMALFYLLTPFLGTPIYDIFREEHLIPDNPTQSRELLVAEFACDTKNFTRKELEELQNYAHTKFMAARIRGYLRNPLRILRKIHSLEDLRYVLRLAKRGLIIKSRLRKYGRLGAKVLYDKGV